MCSSQKTYICINETLLWDGGICFDAHVMSKRSTIKMLTDVFSLKCEIDSIMPGLG